MDLNWTILAASFVNSLFIKLVLLVKLGLLVDENITDSKYAWKMEFSFSPGMKVVDFTELQLLQWQK